MRYNKILTKEFLIEKSLNTRLSMNELSKIVGCDITTIRDHLTKQGIRIKSTSEVKMGIPSGPQSEETKRRKSRKMMGHFVSEETKQKLRRPKWGGTRSTPWMVGKPGHNTGHVATKETRSKMSKFHTGRKCSEERRVKIGNIHRNKVVSDATREKLSKALSGENSPHYIDGRTPLRHAIYNLSEYKDWRTTIFKRDNRTCQECFQKGGHLEAHHIKRFSALFNEFRKTYPNFSPTKDKEKLLELAKTYKPFWRLKNGQTLCRVCHEKKGKRVAR